MIVNMTPDSPEGFRQQQIIENAKPDERTIVSKNFFGDLIIIGENHKEAAEYLTAELAQCKNKADEIKLHLEVKQRFGVAIQIDY